MRSARFMAPTDPESLYGGAHGSELTKARGFAEAYWFSHSKNVRNFCYRESELSIIMMKYFAVNLLYWATNQCCGWKREKNPQDILIATAVIDWLLLNVYGLMIFCITQVPFAGSPHAACPINNHFSGNKSIMQVFALAGAVQSFSSLAGGLWALCNWKLFLGTCGLLSLIGGVIIM